MKQGLVLASCVALLSGSGVGLATHPALAATLCVGGSGCYTSIQQALDHAQNGDTIRIDSGTFAGGVTISASVSLMGAGAGKTIIQGGGPVVTIGSADTTSEPTVSISGVTITGGSNTSVPDPSQPRGGGIWVPQAADGGSGATVSISDSVITGNTVRASAVGDCGPGCTVSASHGGGIASFGMMTLTNTVVSNNQAVWHLSTGANSAGANGGGIRSYGFLTLRGSTVNGNTVTLITTGVMGDFFVDGGGITASDPLTMEGSTVSGNRVLVTTPSIEAYGGGIHTTGNGSATIRGSLISGNSVEVTASGDEGAAIGGGINAENTLVLLDSTVRDNQTRSTMPSPPPDSLGGALGAGLQLRGSTTIKDSTVSGNSGTVTGSPSLAYVAGAAFNNEDGLDVTVADSTITDNTASDTTTRPSGTAILKGAAVHNNGDLTLRNTVVSKNTGVASGSSGLAQGGGIWIDSADLFGGPPGPPAHLSLNDSSVTHNRITASPSITPQGGGVYNGAADGATVTATNSVIAQNIPDQCFDC